ncbi:MAG: hypothetical protein ACLFUK_08930 [Halanaerobium sp.]
MGYRLLVVTIILVMIFLPISVVSAQEIAGLEESYVYKPEYLPADILQKELNLEDLRAEVINEKGYLLLQGTPEKVAEARDILADIDSQESSYQVKYTLTIMDLSQEDSREMELLSAALSSETEADSEFLAEDKLLEFSSLGSIESLQSKLISETDRSFQKARPAVITALGESGSISMEEEFFGMEEEIINPDETSLEISFNPEQINSKGEIKSRLGVELDEVQKLDTATWLKPGKKTLLGLMSLTQKQEGSSIFKKNDSKQRRNFVVYVRAEIINKNPKISASLAGADQLVLASKTEKSFLKENSFQLLFRETGSPETDFYLENQESGIAVEFKNRDKNEFFNLGLNFPLKESLKLGGSLFSQKQEISFAPSLSDYVQLSSNLTLSAGYLPLIYSFSDSEFITNEGWFKAEYKEKNFLLKLSYYSDFYPENLRLETGLAVKEDTYIIMAASGNDLDLDNYLAGLRVDF